MEKGFMTDEELRDFIAKELPRLIAEKPEIRYEILGVVSESFVTRDELKAVLDEIRQLREDFNRRFEEHSLRLEEHSRRIEELAQAIAGLREDFNTGFGELSRAIRELRKSVDTIGSRWGIFVEDTFRNAMSVLLERHFDARVEEITVGGYQVDLLITNGLHILVELTSSVKEKDLENLLKAARAYKDESGAEPLLYVVTAYISPRLYDLAKEKGISILSHDSL